MASPAGSPSTAASTSAPSQSQPDTQHTARTKPASIHGQVMQMEPLTDRLFRWLPEWVREVTQDRRRQLLYVERQMQRRLINEYRAQVRELDPVLRGRGRMLGEALLDVFTGASEKEMTYGEIAASSMPDKVAAKLPVKELIETMDPILTPFIDPFVEGIKDPIYAKVGEVKSSVVQSFAATGAACLVAGFVLGRLTGGSGGGGGRGGR